MKVSLIIILFLINTNIIAKNKINKNNWKGQVNSKSIVINNQYGDIRLRYGGDEDLLEYIAVYQNYNSDNQVYVDRNETKNVMYISTHKKQADKSSKDEDISRIDLTVYVPKNKLLQVRTDDGIIDAKGLNSDLTVITQSGTIHIRKQNGFLSTKNDSGKTKIVLNNTNYKKPQIFESVYGEIFVTINDTSNFKVKMSTSSDIISDFSLEMEKHINQEPNKTAIIKNNKANSEIIMRSKRGTMALKEHREF